MRNWVSESEVNLLKKKKNIRGAERERERKRKTDKIRTEQKKQNRITER